MATHPELSNEQAYLDHAYACLETMRAAARQLQYSVETGAGGTHQARFERDVVYDQGSTRLARLELGGESLCFGRIDRSEPEPDATEPERFYIGRLPVSDTEQNPVIVDWRAPVAEPFYRATGRNPLGLQRRRHFATAGQTLLAIDDEVFDVEALESGDDSGLVGTAALLAALGRSRSGHMRDIVATIQAEQDEIIRAELPGLLIVQGGPGTGKTAVALHRASYLLYTHRFPLERQGVLVVGPNRLFMRYISRVLPSLGESTVVLASIDELYPEVTPVAVESHETVRVKGDLRMAKFIRRAVATRQRGLREDLVVGYGLVRLRVTAEETTELVAAVRRQHRHHNVGRRHLLNLLLERLYSRYLSAMARAGLSDSPSLVAFADFSGAVRRDEAVRFALDRMWPALTPQMLLRDLFGLPALIKAAGRDLLSDSELRALERPRGDSLEDVPWSAADVPLLDEAIQLLGAVEHRRAVTATSGTAGAAALADDATRTYGHIVVDEAQDLSPMQLRMLARRSLSGSMTIVGDIGQATGMWAPADWDQVLAHLPVRRPPRRVELSVGYRTPAEIMLLASRVLAVAAPDLRVPTSVRSSGADPAVVRGIDLADAVARAVQGLAPLVGEGTVGVVCPDGMTAAVRAALAEAGVPLESSGSLGDGVAVVPVSTVKGLEWDGVVVFEPARIVSDSPQGLRALYVALTRATRALAIAHTEPLPSMLTP